MFLLFIACLFIKLVYLTTDNLIVELKKEDLIDDRNKTYLVFIYYEKDDFKCPLCDEFKENINLLKMPIKTLNFANNVELGSLFLQHSFPAFIIRHFGRSYVIEPENPNSLIEILEKESWKEIKPVREIVDVNSFFAYAFSKANVVIFFWINILYFIMNYVPDYIVTLFIVTIIGFLIYSIVDVLRTNNQPKEKLL